jgi:putative pyruvate formate lyase activating enzyme
MGIHPMAPSLPSYIQAHESGELSRKSRLARQKLDNCTLCPRECGVNRLIGETGVCKTGQQAVVSSYSAHFGEEAPLVGNGGSGTIFFTHCSLGCRFCQNYEISNVGVGHEHTSRQLAAVMLHLQEIGCHNINFVTPSHVVPQIIAALETAVPLGLRLPLVYNSSGYDAADTIELLNGIVDIYMPDFKFWDAAVSKKLCNAPDYAEKTKIAVKAMHRQVGDLVLDERGIAQKGLLVRHLVMPGELAGSGKIMQFLAREISKNTYINIMPQYHPCGEAHQIPEISSAITAKAYTSAVAAARQAGLTRLDHRRRVFTLG